MSVFPKKIIRSKDKFVNLHMRVDNGGNKNISGKIVFTIINPKGEKTEIEDKIIIKKKDIVNKYYKFTIAKDALIGRYNIDGRFYFGKSYVKSETYKNDFFDVL